MPTIIERTGHTSQVIEGNLHDADGFRDFGGNDCGVLPAVEDKPVSGVRLGEGDLCSVTQIWKAADVEIPRLLQFLESHGPEKTV